MLPGNDVAGLPELPTSSKPKRQPRTSLHNVSRESAVNTAPTAVAAAPSGPQMPPRTPKIRGEWSSHIFSCFDQCVPSCLVATFCAPFAYARVKYYAGIETGPYTGRQYQENLLVMLGLWLCTYLFSFIPGVHFLGIIPASILFFFYFQLRRHFRQVHQIPGDDCHDCLLSFFCGCCSIGQMMRHSTAYPENADCSLCNYEFGKPAYPYVPVPLPDGAKKSSISGYPKEMKGTNGDVLAAGAQFVNVGVAVNNPAANASKKKNSPGKRISLPDMSKDFAPGEGPQEKEMV